jgi:ketosteroid isomerase-like protein
VIDVPFVGTDLGIENVAHFASWRKVFCDSLQDRRRIGTNSRRIIMSFRAALIVVVALASSTAVQVAAQCTPAQKSQIEAVRDSWKKNWNAKQLDNVVALYAPDATFLPSDGTRNTGTSEIKAALQKQLGSTVTITSVKVDCSGEFAYDSGSYTSDIPASGGGMATNGTTMQGVTMGGAGKRVEGQYLVVLKHQGGGGTILGGSTVIGGSTVVGGGGGFLIVQHAATAKP